MSASAPPAAKGAASNALVDHTQPEAKVEAPVPADTMAWWGWSSRLEVDEYLYSFWHTKGAGNFGHYNDPQIDAGIDKARTILNEDERLKAYKDVQRYIAAKVYCLMGMVNGLSFEMTAPRVHNFLEGDSNVMAFWSQIWLKA